MKALHQENSRNNVYILFDLILASVSFNYIWHIYKLKNKERVGIGIKNEPAPFVWQNWSRERGQVGKRASWLTLYLNKVSLEVEGIKLFGWLLSKSCGSGTVCVTPRCPHAGNRSSETLREGSAFPSNTVGIFWFLIWAINTGLTQNFLRFFKK